MFKNKGCRWCEPLKIREYWVNGCLWGLNELKIIKEIKFKNIPNGLAVENSDPVGLAKFRQIRIKT